MKNVKLSTINGIPLALSNLCYKNDCSVINIQDAAEDSKTGQELVDNLRSLKLLENVVGINRETDTYVRIELRDPFGNTHYLRADK